MASQLACRSPIVAKETAVSQLGFCAFNTASHDEWRLLMSESGCVCPSSENVFPRVNTHREPSLVTSVMALPVPVTA